MMKRFLSFLVASVVVFSLVGCSVHSDQNVYEPAISQQAVVESESVDSSDSVSSVSLDDIPSFSGSPYVVVNDNVPFFDPSDRVTDVFETYSDLDSLGRCGVAYANVCAELMPNEDRESISDVKPSGWKNKKYDFVDGGYLYNRCHLIGFQLTGENANPENLITGTRYMNVEGMLPFENMVADFVKETQYHVLYRVTPVFQGDDLVCSGVLMEAQSVEDDGVQFCVYCYNVQPGVQIDYVTGDNWADKDVSVADSESFDSAGMSEFVLNNKSMKFHKPDCSSVQKMSDENRQDVVASRDELLARGYTACGICNP